MVQNPSQDPAEDPTQNQKPGHTPDQNVIDEVPITGHSSGFGLYLSQMLIETQGGSLSCTSEVGGGTSLTVCMPVCR